MAKPDPWSPHVEPDFRKSSLGDVALSAVKNLGPSAARDVPEIVRPFYPSNWGADINAAKKLAIGLGSRYSPGRYFETPQQRAKNEAPLDAISAAFKGRYGDAGALKQTLATDPFGVLLDASSIATIPAGGEGIAARIPGAVGDVAKAATGTARGLAKATNPAALAVKAVTAPVKLARVVAQGPILDRAGNFSASVKDAVAKAFPSGAIGSAEMADPRFKTVLTDTLTKKGVTPQAVKEAVLAYHDAPTPRSAVTAKAAPKAASETAKDLNTSARAKIGAKAQEIAGASEPSASGLGAELEKAQIAAHNDMQGAYKTAFAHPGAFGPSFTDDLGKTIAAALSKHDLPANLNEFSSYPSFEQAPKALGWLTGHVQDLAAKGELTAPKLERARQELVQLGFDAQGTDAKAVRSIIDGLDKHIQNEAAAGHFEGGDGPGFAADMKAARQSFKDYQNAFRNTDNDVHAAVAKAVKSLEPDQAKDAGTGLITSGAPDGSTAAAQGALSAKLLNPKTLVTPPGAEKLYGKLRDVMGGDGTPGHEALDQFLRQSALRTDENGHLAVSPSNLRGFLDGPLGHVFSPEEQTQARLLGAGHDVLAAPQAGRSESLLKEMTGRGVRAGLGVMGGALVGPHIGAEPATAAMFAGLGEQAALEPLRAVGQRVAEGKGAPANLGLLRHAEGLGDLTEKAAAASPLAFEAQHLAEQMQPKPEEDMHTEPAAPVPDDWDQHVLPEDRAERKDGGRIEDDVERLVGRLLARVDHARRQSNKTTEPLLRVPDESIVRALGVAQQAI